MRMNNALCFSVHLVELCGTGQYFAMKAMDKGMMLNRNKVRVFKIKVVCFLYLFASNEVFSDSAGAQSLCRERNPRHVRPPFSSCSLCFVSGLDKQVIFFFR